MRRCFAVRAAAALAATLFCAQSLLAADPATDFSVHKVFGDHMVLQQGRPVQLSGRATPNALVTVAIQRDAPASGQDAVYPPIGKKLVCEYTADAEGRWRSAAPALPAGGPYTITVSGADGVAPVVFKDVLVGEVWLGSGQSNMEFRVYPGPNAKFATSMNGAREAADANYPNIRLYNASSRKYTSPSQIHEEPVGPGWVVCSPETVGNFSAVAYFFGRDLYKELNVPVGLISASWGGTRIEPWISRTAFAEAGRTAEVDAIDLMAAADPKEREAKAKAAREKAMQAFAVWEKRFNDSDPAATAAAAAWKNPDFDDSAWQAVTQLASSIPESQDGTAWYRRAVELPADWDGKSVVLSLGAVDDCDETYLNGQLVGATGTDVDAYWSHKRKYNVPAGVAKAGRNVVAVRVRDFFSSGGIQGAANELYLALASDPSKKVELSGTWRFKMEFVADLKKIGSRPNAEMASGDPTKNPSFPSTLYNSMINPWTVYPMRGFLWYQGESNSGQPEDYLRLHKLLISDWRARWNDPDLSFLFVQLAGYEKHTPANRLPDDFWKDRAPGDPAWAKFREAQAATLSVPGTGMAVSIDVGDHSDIHPADKQSVGYRLAAEALRVTYGRNIVSAGPYYKSMKADGDKAVVRFANVGKGLAAKDGGDKLTGFAVAGADGKFVWADAKIVDDTVVVTSPQVKEPKAVRYGWVSYADNLNFYNKDGFPAAPFRTDSPDYVK